MAKKSALGRGLGALLDNTESDFISKQIPKEETAAGSISGIAISHIEANPFQPRTRFDQEKLD
jgi:ParB family chromosome partitioning protein